MSPGVGLRPTPPPLFRPQGHSHPRSDLHSGPQAQSGAPDFTASLRSEPGVACRPSGRHSGGGIPRRLMPGDMVPESLQATPSTCGGVEHPDKTQGINTLSEVRRKAMRSDEHTTELTSSHHLTNT